MCWLLSCGCCFMMDSFCIVIWYFILIFELFIAEIQSILLFSYVKLLVFWERRAILITMFVIFLFCPRKLEGVRLPPQDLPHVYIDGLKIVCFMELALQILMTFHLWLVRVEARLSAGLVKQSHFIAYYLVQRA